jgi:hypothetical protein
MRMLGPGRTLLAILSSIRNYLPLSALILALLYDFSAKDLSQIIEQSVVAICLPFLLYKSRINKAQSTKINIKEHNKDIVNDYIQASAGIVC